MATRDLVPIWAAQPILGPTAPAPMGPTVTHGERTTKGWISTRPYHDLPTGDDHAGMQDGRVGDRDLG